MSKPRRKHGIRRLNITPKGHAILEAIDQGAYRFKRRGEGQQRSTNGRWASHRGTSK